MLDVKLVQEKPDFVIKKMAARGLDIDLDEYLTLSQEKKISDETEQKLVTAIAKFKEQFTN